MKKKETMILVTGATGLVGGHLIWHLLQQNEVITAIRRQHSNLESLRSVFGFYTDNPESYLNRIIWKVADMNDFESLKNALTGIELVYHCAAMVSLGNTGNEMIDVNVNGTKMIVDLCLELNIKKLCFVSSIAACGQLPGKNPVNEETPFYPENVRSNYARSKYLSEQEVWRGISKGLNAVIVNPGVILGYSGNDSGSAKLFSLVKKGLIFYTNGGTGYVDVQDVVKIMIALTESSISSERYILVGENKCNRDILGYIAHGLGKPKPFIGMGSILLISIGALMEFAGKLFGFTPLLDRAGAKSATNRSWYSNQKLLNELQIKFTPIDACITGVCQFMNRKSV